MTTPQSDRVTLRELDTPTQALVRLSAVVTAGSDVDVRAAVAHAAGRIPAAWVEELLLQSYLFAGFPRALNAMREWRRVSPEIVDEQSVRDVDQWQAAGVDTCAAVYGSMYDKLRENIRRLHPLLDEWMITEGYGKVLSRSGLDLPRRELCIVAACAVAYQDRQLHSHLHGALNVGVDAPVIDAVISAIADLLGEARTKSVRLLCARVARGEKE
ncbi:MAG TPA: carboxymuconolactone decarboxylase family protein [Gemmatimonadaceae bacterium]|nr:carboxymuconolactone decarboxylase family protein [Gemmatimonadaceae bacterium]